jgi:MFS family permease
LAEESTDTDGNRPGPGPALWKDPVVGPLGAGQLISAFGSAMVGLALVYLSYDRTGSVFRTVLVTAAYALPSALFGVVAGRIAQHHDRRRILIGSYALKVGIYAAVAAIEATVGLSANGILVLSLINGSVAALTFPSWQALERELIDADRLSIANAYFSSVTAAAQLIGVAGGGVLLSVMGPTWVFLLNAASYLPEMVVVARLHPAAVGAGEGGAEREKGHEFSAAVAAIREVPALRRGFASLLAVSLLAAPVLQLLPAVGAEISSGAHTLGFLMGAFSLGGLAVTWVMKQLRRHRSGMALVAAGLGVIAVALIGFGISNWLLDGRALYVPVLAGLVVLGLTIALVDSALNAIVQAGAPPEVQGSVFAIYGIVYTAIAPLSALVLAFVADPVDVYALLSICGALLAGFGWAESRLLGRRGGGTDSSEAAVEQHPQRRAHLLLGLVPNRMHPSSVPGTAAAHR